MITVYKFAFGANQSELALSIPLNAKPVHVAVQNRRITMWFELDTEEEKVDRHFKVVPTGAEVPEQGTHIQSILDGEFVWHIYEEAIHE